MIEEGDGGVILSELWDAERFWEAAGLLWSSSTRDARRASPWRSSSSLLIFPESPCFVEKSVKATTSHNWFRVEALSQINRLKLYK